ncbi:PHA/PHB synthase family protein [Alkalilimnicola sp. S0819]|uniref:PHA/PHB synthase family protein n=1 Tax=Alkalilimnicola sp. S0819 TaxID=2613922 RepID=UPI001262A453|nr:class I poly(R)-hydroxyalkanoic acid synthase [Alkalilimnicola sp. S0819]KAB7622794.1 class I poly(R)-hydroxyalkanoic acid synthase [Alkalilimnicola sp. S0819]MPQ17290.1 class I poly(R)-hydroxyalkanoic acid synthase [Alkalilimnicola sp. S0819]
MAGNAAAEKRETVDAREMARSVMDIASKSQQLVKDFLAKEQDAANITVDDALHMSRLFQEFNSRLMANPTQLIQAQMAFWQNYMQLLQSASLRMMGFRSEAVTAPHKGDKRFRHEAWEENPLFDFIKQSYLLTSDYIHSVVKNVEGLDDLTAKKVNFYTRAFIDALSPTNFVMTNPEVLRKTLDTRGQNLLNGLNNLLDDLSKGGGITMTDLEAFEVGKNIAITPGKVVYQTDMMQLIQYSPSTEKVHKRPVLFIPPWINKFYIVDLRPNNSLLKWLVDQGHTVFAISWKNPPAEYADKGFEDYMLEGPVAALDAIEQATGEREINSIGYCLGGTLQACTLAYLAAKGDDRVKSATYFTTMLDFEQPGELEVFIDEEQITALEKRMNEKGMLEGKTMATTMSSLRANDLIWSFFVNNYLHGNDPFPFDLLYWNSDATNMPARMHSFYLRNMYQHNRLKEPGGIELAGEKIDLSKITIPVFFISAIDDHIAPWKSTYAGTQLHGGPVKFVLGGSGHIAGIVNPPEKNKYGYWTSTKKTADPDEWLESATQNEGSWWPEWGKWIAHKAGAKVEARQPGDGKLKPIEDAPGSYVKEKA